MGYKPLSGKYLDHQTFHDLLMGEANFARILIAATFYGTLTHASVYLFLPFLFDTILGAVIALFLQCMGTSLIRHGRG